MPNAIALFVKFIVLLDEVYKAASKTAVLDTAEKAEMVRGTHEFKVPKMSMDGLAEYGRKGGGYKSGSVTLEYETKKPDYDRGRSFEVDEMDDEESAGIAFGRLASEFVRTRVVPELDAYRFSVYASKAGNSASGTLAKADALMTAISTALTTMREKEVGETGLYLFITPTLRQMIRDMDSYKSKEALSAFADVIEVPQSRFYTAIDLLDGSTSGEEAGFFKKDADGVDINFMIISKSATAEQAHGEQGVPPRREPGLGRVEILLPLVRNRGDPGQQGGRNLPAQEGGVRRRGMKRVGLIKDKERKQGGAGNNGDNPPNKNEQDGGARNTPRT